MMFKRHSSRLIDLRKLSYYADLECAALILLASMASVTMVSVIMGLLTTALLVIVGYFSKGTVKSYRTKKNN